MLRIKLWILAAATLLIPSLALAENSTSSIKTNRDAMASSVISKPGLQTQRGPASQTLVFLPPDKASLESFVTEERTQARGALGRLGGGFIRESTDSSPPWKLTDPGKIMLPSLPMIEGALPPSIPGTQADAYLR